MNSSSAFDPAAVQADARASPRGRPPSGLETYGLLPEQVDERFTVYNKRFGSYIGQRGAAHG